MNRSESITAISKALCEFQSKVKIVPFDKTNPFFKSRYATLSSVAERVQKELHANGLSYIQSASEDKLTTMLMHTSGEFLSNTIPLVISKNDMQGVGAAVTYAKRFGLISILGVVADEEDENDVLPEKPKQAVQQQIATQASESQRKMLFATSKSKNMSDADLKALLKDFGYESTKDIKASDVNKIKAKIEST